MRPYRFKRRLMMKQSLSRTWLLAFLMANVLLLTSCSSEQTNPVDLPWQATVNAEGNVDAFGITIGKTTLRETMMHFKSFPETGLFVDEDGTSALESYFGKKRVGLFEAKLVAESDASEAVRKGMLERALERKPQPSGKWRYRLSEDDVRVSNELPVKYLVYIPVVDYEQERIETLFGQPEGTHAMTEKAVYWFYPKKGLILLLNNDGGDIMYYSPTRHYAALRERLVTMKIEKE